MMILPSGCTARALCPCAAHELLKLKGVTPTPAANSVSAASNGVRSTRCQRKHAAE